MNWRFVVDWVPVLIIPFFVTFILFSYLTLAKDGLPLPRFGQKYARSIDSDKITLFFSLLFSFFSAFMIILLPLTTRGTESGYRHYLLLLFAGIIFFSGLLIGGKVVAEKWK